MSDKMYGAFLIIAYGSFAQLSGSACFQFSITRDLNSAMQLTKTEWTHVEVNTSDESIFLKFDIPRQLPYSGVFIFFANDTKAILRVKLGRTAEAKFYAAPYNLINSQLGVEETTKVENNDFCHVFGSFPKAWLPEKCNKVSAAVVGPNGRHFNYYKLQNFKISLPDLMVVEEYLKIPDSIEN